MDTDCIRGRFGFYNSPFSHPFPIPVPAPPPPPEPLPAGLNLSRVAYSDRGPNGLYQGLAYVLTGYEKLIGGRVRNHNKKWEYFPPAHPERAGLSVNECASLVQAFGVPGTKTWRRGPRVKDLSAILPGTVIATLADGVYYSDYSARSHVAIYTGKTADGIWVVDQYNGADIDRRLKRYNVDSSALVDFKKDANKLWNVPIRDGKGGLVGYGPLPTQASKGKKFSWVGDGDEYYVLLADGNVAFTPMSEADVKAYLAKQVALQAKAAAR